MNWVAPGAVLAGKYALERKLGQGGMGAVWRAEHVQLRSPVAVKIIDEQIAQHPEALARFLREAQSAAALRSPHVVQILDYGADRGVPFIAMELLEGESLADRLHRVGRLPPAEVGRIITEVARAIGKAHERSIVHRDLKPDNIFLVQNDEEEVTKVLDFGIAKATQGIGVASSSTRTGAILGTPHYMSPEQAEGTKLVDHRTDVWALGVIAFECLVGRRPFDSDALGSLLLAICTRPMPVPSAYGCELPEFDAWFEKACARELSQRFQSARELASELRRICGTPEAQTSSRLRESRALASTARMQTPFVTVPATAGVASTQAPTTARRRGVALGVAGGLAVALFAAVTVYTMKPHPEDTAPALSASGPAVTTASSPHIGAEAASAPAPVAPKPEAPNVTPELVTAAAPSAAASTRAAPHAPTRPKTVPRRVERPAPAAAKPQQSKINLGI